MNIGSSHVSSFWRKVEKTESCWIWKGATQKTGHGRVRINGKLLGTHRVSYFLKHGKINDDLMVCHKCNNPSCVNPDHLYQGDNSDNMIDSVYARTLNFVKLTPSQVVEIKKRFARGESNKSIARSFGVARSTINCIRLGRTWSHLKLDNLSDSLLG